MRYFFFLCIFYYSNRHYKLNILLFQGVFGVYQGASNHEELHNLIKATVMIRRLKKDVLYELPVKRRQQVCNVLISSVISNSTAVWFVGCSFVWLGEKWTLCSQIHSFKWYLGVIFILKHLWWIWNRKA